MERTVVLVKPDAYERGLLGEITRRFESSTLHLAGVKMLVPTRKMARAHYALSMPAAGDEDDAAAAAAEERLSACAAFLSSGPVVALALEGADAVSAALAIAGSADPRTAEPGTVRGDLSSAPERNLVEVSPDAATAKRELALWFKPDELASPQPSGSSIALSTPAPAAGGAVGESRPGVRLPQPGKRNVLVTSALPYVNNVPHLGNIIGCVLSADVYARYLRQRGVNVIYMCGTDEYGTATEIKALSEGLTPQQICDKYHAIHRDVYAWFDIRFDQFGRTSTPYQQEIVQSMFWDVHGNGYTLTKTTEQLYSEPLGKFLADRYVQGTCPLCGYDDARGDQCDACGKLLNPTELVNPRCVASGATPVKRTTEHLYIDLPRLTEPLEAWIAQASVDGFWTHNSLATTHAWLKTGLQARCITRDLKWGVPVPLAGWEHKVFYVWFDAPIGYISITAAYAGEAWRQWWQPAPELDVKLVQFMGKDNIPFHTVIFPATLIASGRPWLRMHHISTTEYLNYEEGKFSKSRGTGVFGDTVQETGISTAVFRFYLLANRPESCDSAFKWDDLAAKNNNELLANLGNFVNRAATFTKSKYGSRVPQLTGLDGPVEAKLVRDVNETLSLYHAALESVNIKEGLKHAMGLSRLGNVYLQEGAPWKTIKSDPSAAATCCAVALNLCRLLAVVFEPYMGSAFSAQIFRMLGLVHSDETNQIPDRFELTLPSGHAIGEPELLFRTISEEEVAALRKRFGGTQDEAAANAQAVEPVFAADLRVGEVRDVQPHPESADRLWILSVGMGGDDVRQIVAGVREHYAQPADLLGRKVVIVCNLRPASLRGVESQGMMLCAAKKDDFGLLLAPADAAPGSRVFAGELRNPGEEEGGSGFKYPTLELKEFQKIPLTVGSGLVGMFKKVNPLNVAGVPVVAERVAEGAKIK